MSKQEVQQFLRDMGFSEPCPTHTMSKNIQLKTGEIIVLNVWAGDYPASYIYFGCDDYKLPFRLLGIDYDWHHENCNRPSVYPKVTCKEDVEKVCLTLTGKYIYDVNIPEPKGQREQIMNNYNAIKSFGKNGDYYYKDGNYHPKQKKGLLQRLFGW